MNVELSQSTFHIDQCTPTKADESIDLIEDRTILSSLDLTESVHCLRDEGISISVSIFAFDSLTPLEIQFLETD